MKRIRIALFFSQSTENETLSYQHGWPQAFINSDLFECEKYNIASNDLTHQLLISYSLTKKKFDAIVLLHSIFSNQQNLKGLLFLIIAQCKIPKIYFIGNEYKLLPNKMKFCRRLGIDLLISQSNDSKILEIYKKNLGCNVASIPNTGFDSLIFKPLKSLDSRKIDIGYRAYDSPLYLGNNEKFEIANLFIQISKKFRLNVDISLDPNKRFNSLNYALFLNNCRAQLGTESGGDYFDITDELRKKVNTYLIENNNTTWNQIKDIFFHEKIKKIPIRIISGRQVEAAACKTIHLLYEGRYNNYLLPNIHYIPIKKDGSNIDEVIDMLKDDKLCKEITLNAYDLVMSEFTYQKLIFKFYNIIKQII